MLRGKATLPLWFEPSHDYVGPAVTEIIYGPVGLIRAGFSAVGLFIGRKSKISQEQNVKEFQFLGLLGSIIKKYLKVADPLKKSRLLFFGCFDLESDRIKLSRPCMYIYIYICLYLFDAIMGYGSDSSQLT